MDPGGPWVHPPAHLPSPPLCSPQLTSSGSAACPSAHCLVTPKRAASQVDTPSPSAQRSGGSPGAEVKVKRPLRWGSVPWWKQAGAPGGGGLVLGDGRVWGSGGGGGTNRQRAGAELCGWAGAPLLPAWTPPRRPAGSTGAGPRATSAAARHRTRRSSGRCRRSRTVDPPLPPLLPPLLLPPPWAAAPACRSPAAAEQPRGCLAAARSEGCGVATAHRSLPRSRCCSDLGAVLKPHASAAGAVSWRWRPRAAAGGGEVAGPRRRCRRRCRRHCCSRTSHARPWPHVLH